MLYLQLSRQLYRLRQVKHTLIIDIYCNIYICICIIYARIVIFTYLDFQKANSFHVYLLHGSSNPSKAKMLIFSGSSQSFLLKSYKTHVQECLGQRNFTGILQVKDGSSSSKVTACAVEGHGASGVQMNLENADVGASGLCGPAPPMERDVDYPASPADPSTAFLLGMWWET